MSAAPTVAPGGGQGPAMTVGTGIVRGRYFETMGIALLQGRLFSTHDRSGSPSVAIVDDVLARRMWTNEAAAIGQHVRFGTGPGAETRTVVGVVRHVSHLEPGRASLPMAYAPQSQYYRARDVHGHPHDGRSSCAHAGGESGAGIGGPVGADVLR